MFYMFIYMFFFCFHTQIEFQGHAYVSRAVIMPPATRTRMSPTKFECMSALCVSTIASMYQRVAGRIHALYISSTRTHTCM